MNFAKLTPEELRKHKGISFTGITTHRRIIMIWVTAAQIILAVLLSGVILMQQQGSGLGGTFGGRKFLII